MKTFTRVCIGIALVTIGLGIALMILAAFVRPTFNHRANYAFNESYDNISALDFEIAYGDVKIVEGDGFSIDTSHLYSETAFESSVTDGIWTIRDTQESTFHIFGINLPIAFSWDGEDLTPEITITVPKGFNAKDINLEMKAGRLTADNIVADTGSFAVDAGEMVINSLEIQGDSEYKLGTGHMSIENADVKNINIDCGVGYINMKGVVTGESNVTNNIGKVNLDLAGDVNNYSYDIDSDLGNVIINGESYHNSRIGRDSLDETDGSFSLNNHIGNITLDIN